MDWPYYTYRDGYLYDEDGYRLGNTPRFSSASDAETYLEDNDIRGNVK
jgi:hypothetical protein